MTQCQLTDSEVERSGDAHKIDYFIFPMPLIAPTTHKIVIVGDSSVGKSSIVQRLVQDTFSEDGTTTCGADFYTYACPVNNDTVKLQIWDTAGQERFRSISKSYFRNAVGAILVYDITNVTSFDQSAEWLHDLQTLAAPNAYVLLVGNKADLEDQRQVGAEMVKAFVNTNHLEAIETSAFSGHNIKEAFARMSVEVSTRVASGQISLRPGQTRPAELGSGVKGRGCC
jgi:small GTP-binding protein